jgi:hypothetical protein
MVSGRRLYESFLDSYSNLDKKDKCDAQRQYRKVYRETLQLYPQFKDQQTFKLAFFYLDLPVFLSLGNVLEVLWLI